MKKLINKIKDWVITLFGGCSRETVMRYKRILDEREQIVYEMKVLIDKKDARIAELKQRERDLLDVIHEEQVNELMRGIEDDRN